MKQVTDFLKTTALGGLFVLLPVLLLYLLVAEAIDLIIAVSSPIAHLFPKGIFENEEFPGIMALILLFGMSFLIGLGMRSETGRNIGQWIEKNILGRLPAYDAIKVLVAGFTEEEKKSVKTAVMKTSDDEREIVYVIEDHGDGEVTILQPWAPAAFAGSTKIVSRDRITLLDADLGEASKVMSHWGVGTKTLLGKGIAVPAPPAAAITEKTDSGEPTI